MADGKKKYRVTTPKGDTFERELDDNQLGRVPEGFSVEPIEMERAPETTAAPETSAEPTPPFATAERPAVPEPVPTTPAQPAPTDQPTPEETEPSVWEKAYAGLKRGGEIVAGVPSSLAHLATEPVDWFARSFEALDPEIRGVARATTLNFAPTQGPYAGAFVQEGLEAMFPVDEPGLPPREYAGRDIPLGRSTDPNRPRGVTMGRQYQESEEAEYGKQAAEHPVRTGVGYVAGAAPIGAAMTPFVAPVAGETALLSTGRAALGSGLLGGAEAVHTGDPVEVLKQGAISAAIPVATEQAGRLIGSAENTMREMASRHRLAAATGTRPYGAQARKLRQDKGPEKLARMGEVVEESGMHGGMGPLPRYKTSYMQRAEDVRQQAGQRIGEINDELGGAGVPVDLGPTIQALREEGMRLARMAPRRAKQQGQELLDMAEEYTYATRTQGRRPPTAAEAQKRADAIMSRAAKEQNEVIDIGRAAGWSNDEIMQQTEMIALKAEERAQNALRTSENPFETDYKTAHELRQWLDDEAWSNRTGDALQSQWSRQARQIAANIRRSIDEAVESESSHLAQSLKRANEEYETAAWVRHHGDVGSSGRTSELAAGGAAGLAGAMTGDVGTAMGTAVPTYIGLEGVRRYGPSVVAGGARAGQRIAEMAPDVMRTIGRTAGPVYAMTPDFDEAPQSNEEIERVLSLLEQDPEYFGNASNAVRQAAEAGRLRAMRFTIANAMQQQQGAQ